jgi:serine/threonine protein kinase
VELSSPRILGRYALYDRIAAGGMATVHLGRLLGPVGFSRTVAIKRLQPQFAEDPEFVAMFLDEARLAARVRHPNVVPTLEVVSTEGELFLVMEYVQGDSLARLIRAGHSRGESPPPALIATMMVGVLSGLHAAHEAKNEHGEPLDIVHRDVSPHNIIVGIDGVARVLDFGVAKAVGRLQTTRDGQLKGKLAYMAPEQLRGSVTRASDVYSASVVLWEALVGRRVFQGETEGELFAKVIEGRVESPSLHASGIPPALDAAIMRGSDPDPAKRFSTAKEMARAVADAVSLVDSSVIGEWVESLAKHTLDSRSDLIATIESDSWQRASASPSNAPHVSPGPPEPGEAPAPDSFDIPIVAEEALPTQLSSGSVSAREKPAWTPSSFPTRTRWKPIAAAVAIASCLVAALFLASPHQRPSAVPPVPESAAAALPAPPSAEPSPSARPEVEAVPSAAPPTSATPASPPTLATARAPTPVARPAPAPPPPSVRHAPPVALPAKPGANCNPPYYFQGGVRVFKTECL